MDLDCLNCLLQALALLELGKFSHARQVLHKWSNVDEQSAAQYRGQFVVTRDSDDFVAASRLLRQLQTNQDSGFELLHPRAPAVWKSPQLLSATESVDTLLLLTCTYSLPIRTMRCALLRLPINRITTSLVHTVQDRQDCYTWQLTNVATEQVRRACPANTPIDEALSSR